MNDQPRKVWGRLSLVGIVLALFAILFVLIVRNGPEYLVHNSGIEDKLAYVTNDHRLILYDPGIRSETLLLENVENFRIGQSGQIAFTRPDDDDNTLYVYDPATPDIPPHAIMQGASINRAPLKWSPDGRALVFDAYEVDGDHTLYVWDGENVTNIMPEDGLGLARLFTVEWREDGHLAFTIMHNWSNDIIPNEVYIWDGHMTTNLSQNPEINDVVIQWSNDGKLLLGSWIDDEMQIYVWDGVSFANGVPDADSFVSVAPEFEQIISPRWIDNKTIGFVTPAGNSLDNAKQIVLWDVDRETLVTQNPLASENAWSRLTENGQVVLSSQPASGLPSYYLDVEDIEGNIMFSDEIGEYAWSQGGYLAYCGIEPDGAVRLLSVWDGSDSRIVARVSGRPVQWMYGQKTFSCNNG